MCHTDAAYNGFGAAPPSPSPNVRLPACGLRSGDRCAPRGEIEADGRAGEAHSLGSERGETRKEPGNLNGGRQQAPFPRTTTTSETTTLRPVPPPQSEVPTRTPNAPHLAPQGHQVPYLFSKNQLREVNINATTYP